MADRNGANRHRQEEALLDLIDAVLSDYFFDPHAEDPYKDHLSAARAHPNRSVLMMEWCWNSNGMPFSVRLEAQAAWTRLRVTLRRAAAAVVVEGNWSFDRERLQQAVVLEDPAQAGELRPLIAAVHARLLSGGADDDPA